MRCRICEKDEHYCSSCDRLEYLDHGICSSCYEEYHFSIIFREKEDQEELFNEKWEEGIARMVNWVKEFRNQFRKRPDNDKT